MESCDNFSYMMLNLVGEVGEFASKVAKQIRRGDMHIGAFKTDDLSYDLPIDEAIEINDELMKEAGDILWQLSGVCNVMGWELEDIAKMNLEKLASRKNRGVIDGDGDNR